MTTYTIKEALDPNNPISIFILAAFSSLKKEKQDLLVNRSNNYDINITFNGIEIDLKSVMTYIHDAYEQEMTRKARELLMAKPENFEAINELNDKIYKYTEALTQFSKDKCQELFPELDIYKDDL